MSAPRSSGHPLPRVAEVQHVTAFLDSPDSPDITNPIHSTVIAATYGFRAALVGGVTAYGWTVPAILAVTGPRWLDDGWADIAFKRPIFPDDRLEVRVESGDTGDTTLTVTNQSGAQCIEGQLALGRASWLAGLALPARRTPEPPLFDPPVLTLETAPVGEDLRPMAVPLSLDDAAAYARHSQRDVRSVWTGPDARIHPGWLAARMTHLLHHNFSYGPSIHARSQVQHLGPARPGEGVVVAGRLAGVHERKGHHYAVLDGLILAGDGRELVRIRHTTIFRIAAPS